MSQYLEGILCHICMKITKSTSICGMLSVYKGCTICAGGGGCSKILARYLLLCGFFRRQKKKNCVKNIEHRLPHFSFGFVLFFAPSILCRYVGASSQLRWVSWVTVVSSSVDNFFFLFSFFVGFLAPFLF